MKKFQLFKKTVAVALTALAVGAVFTASAAKTDLTDIAGHWSADYVTYGVEKGYINGYPDGSFLPDNPVNRAEFSKMVNSALGITKAVDVTFADLDEGEWYYNEVGKALYAGYVSGYEDGSFRATNRITRQETAVILSRIATRAEKSVTLDAYKDADDVASWAKAAFEFASAKGYFGGDDQGRLLPNDILTRGQAAKIIYMLVTGETVQNGKYVVTPENAICSEILFTDGVEFVSEQEGASLVFDGCRVLGDVIVSTTDEARVTIKDSALGTLEISGGGATVMTDNSTVSYVDIKSPSSLSGDGYRAVYLTGRKLVEGVVSLPESVEYVFVSANAVASAKAIENVQVTSPASITFQKGDIENMTVAKAAVGSTVTLAEDVDVKSLEVNAACSFMGSGTIQNAKNNVSGVTYETAPKKVSGFSATTGDKEDEDTGKFTVRTSNPESSDTGVSVSSGITLTFNRPVYDDDGDKPTASYLKNNIELRRLTSGGTKIGFTASLSTSSRILIKPSDDFSANTKYYVIIPKGAFTDADGNENERFSMYFTTKKSTSSSDDDEDDDATITFSPKKGEDDVDVTDDFKITFSSAIRDSDGDTVTNAYLERDAIELREKSLSGDAVDISASINSTKKIVTVTPEEPLKPGTKYYLIVTSGSLEFSGGKNIPRTYTYFTTSEDLGATVTPANAATAVAPDTEIVIKFNAEIYRPSGSNITSSYLTEQALELHKTKATGTELDFTAVIESDRKTIRIMPAEKLEEGTKYYIIMESGMVATEDGVENKKISSYFTVANAMTPIFKPADDSEEVDPATHITISFNEPLFDKEKKPITAEYVAEKVVKFRKNSSSGSEVAFEVELSEDLSTITLIPKKTLSANTKYYVAVTKSTLYNEAGKANVSGSATFETSLSGAPDFMPYNGEKNVSISTDIDITFDRKMYAIGGATLSKTYVKNNVVELYKDSIDGTPVAFDVALSADRQTITLEPSAKLIGNTVYVVVIRKGSLEDSNGNENGIYTSSFTTKDVVNTDVTILPDNREKDVSLNPEITVTFASPVYRAKDVVASDTYLLNNVFELRKKSTSGEKIKFTVSLDEENKVATIKPDQALEPKTTYYVKLLSGSLVYADGKTTVSAKNSYFTTGDGKPAVRTFTVEETGASYVTTEIVSEVDGTAFVTVYDGKEAVGEETADVKAGEKMLVTVSGLKADTSYTVKAYVKNDANVSSNVTEAISFKTTGSFAFEVIEATEDTITVKVTVLCDGSLDLAYTNTKTDKTTDRVTGLALSKDTEREFTLSGLDSDTEYEIVAVFTDEFDGKVTSTVIESTLEPKVEVLEITSLVVIGANNDTYSAEIKDGKAEVAIEKTESIKLRGESSVENSVFTYNGGEEVAPGKDSAAITVVPGESTVVTVELASKDTENTVSCEVTIVVHE